MQFDKEDQEFLRKLELFFSGIHEYLDGIENGIFQREPPHKETAAGFIKKYINIIVEPCVRSSPKILCNPWLLSLYTNNMKMVVFRTYQLYIYQLQFLDTRGYLTAIVGSYPHVSGQL